jgi:hypothetical protein
MFAEHVFAKQNIDAPFGFGMPLLESHSVQGIERLDPLRVCVFRNLDIEPLGFANRKRRRCSGSAIEIEVGKLIDHGRIGNDRIVKFKFAE